jgi:hypothetical protein
VAINKDINDRKADRLGKQPREEVPVENEGDAKNLDLQMRDDIEVDVLDNDTCKDPHEEVVENKIEINAVVDDDAKNKDQEEVEKENDVDVGGERRCVKKEVKAEEDAPFMDDCEIKEIVKKMSLVSESNVNLKENERLNSLFNELKKKLNIFKTKDKGGLEGAEAVDKENRDTGNFIRAHPTPASLSSTILSSYKSQDEREREETVEGDCEYGTQLQKPTLTFSRSEFLPPDKPKPSDLSFNGGSALYKTAIERQIRESPFKKPLRRFDPNCYVPKMQLPLIDPEDEDKLDIQFTIPSWAKDPKLKSHTRHQSHTVLEQYFKSSESLNLMDLFPGNSKARNDSPNRWPLDQ